MSKHDRRPKNDSGRTGPQSSYHRVETDAGTLVYEILRERAPLTGESIVAYDLHGFEDVTDWGALADELAARGHGRGAIHHHPDLDGGDDALHG